MPRKNKQKSNSLTSSSPLSGNRRHLTDGEVFRNFFAVVDDIDPHEALKYLKEMFHGKLDEDVVAMIFSECGYNVDQALESLIALSNDTQHLEDPFALGNCSSDSIVPKKFSQNHTEAKCLSSNDSASNYQEKSLASHITRKQGNENIEQVILEQDSHQAFVFHNKSQSDAAENINFRTQIMPTGIFRVKENTEYKNTNSVDDLYSKDVAFKSLVDSSPFQTEGYNSSQALVNRYDLHESASSKSTPFFKNTIRARSCSPSSSQYASLLKGNDDKDSHQFITPVVSFRKKPLTVFSSPPNCDVPVLLNESAKILHGSKNDKDKRNSNSDLQVSEKIRLVAKLVARSVPVLIILRGLPGSGKSTLARQLKSSGVILSTDDYFYIGGKYMFDFTKLSEAHEWNRRRTIYALKKGITPVIIDNTNVEAWEMIPYIKLGLKYKYEIEVLEPATPWKFKPGKLAKKNRHGVHREKIKKMLERYVDTKTVEKIVEQFKSAHLENQKCLQSKSGKPKLKNKVKEQPLKGEPSYTIAENSNSFDSDSLSSEICNLSQDGCISLEAIVHQEDSSDVSEVSSVDLKNADNEEFSVDLKNVNIEESLVDLKNVGIEESLTHMKNVDIEESLIDLKNADNEETLIDLKNVDIEESSNDEKSDKHILFEFENELKITNLNDLKVLTQEDSEESHSVSQQISSTESSQDIPCWEAITEHDDDFCWAANTTNVVIDDKSNLDAVLKNCDSENESKFHNSEKIIEASSNNLMVSKHDSPKILKSLETENFYEKTVDVSEGVLWSPVDEIKSSSKKSEINFVESADREFSPVPCPKPKRDSLPFKICSVADEFPTKSNNNSVNLKTRVSEWEIYDPGTGTWESYITGNDKVSSNEDLAMPKPPRLQNKSLTANTLSSNSSDLKTQITSACKDYDTSQLRSSAVRIVANFNHPIDITDKVSNQHDWILPIFPSENLSVPAKIDKTILTFTDAESQTEPSDFVLLYKVETNPLYISSLKVISASGKTEGNLGTESLNQGDEVHELIPETPCFDKSTLTDEISEDMDLGDKVKILKGCFPEISEDDLKHLLNLCDGDNMWLSNILLEWGYKYNKPDSFCKYSNAIILSLEEKSEDSLKQVGKSQLDTLKNRLGFEFNTEPYMVDDVFACKDEPKTSSAPENVNLDELKFTFDPILAAKLEKMFGPVIERKSSSLPASHRQITLNIEAAKLLYDIWKDTVQKLPFPEEKIREMTSIQQTETPYLSSDSYTSHQTDFSRQISSEPLPLSEIMDMEYALQLHKEEKMKNRKHTENDMAVELRRQKLYSMFPGVDSVALDDIFEANDCCLENTVVALEEDVGKPAKVVQNYAFEYVPETDIQESPLKDFVYENWQGWVHENALRVQQKPDLQTSQPIYSSEAEDLRAEAVTHYQLRQECMSKAHSAYYRGMRDVASVYAQESDLHARKFKEANKRAVEVIIEHRNQSLDPFVLDLHGLYVKEAIPVLGKFLRNKKHELFNRPAGDQTVTILTGRGAHSLNGAKLRPSVINYLKSQGHKFNETDLGVFTINMSAMCSQS